MSHVISANARVSECGLDILRALAGPLLTNACFDGWRDERFAEKWVESLISPISASLRRISERSPHLIHLELRSTAILKSGDDYQWLMNDGAFP